MPTGLEEASAILTFVQVGFSLARTFTTLIGEYREAPDELATLANAIVDTLAHIETIKRLLEENETTHGWNANGIDLATSCLQEAERLVKRIVTLLRKSGADIPPNDRIGPEDISISVLRRVAWSRFTGRIGKINESLAATRQKMLLILTLYRAFTVDSQEQQRLERDRVVVLVRGRQGQRARRKYPGQHSNTPSNTRFIRHEQEGDPVAQDTVSSRERSQEVLDGGGPETTTVAVPELPARLDTLDEVKNVHDVENSREHNPDAHERCGNAESPLRETQEASASSDESAKAANSPTVPPANRPADDESTPTAVEGQSCLCVDKEQTCPPNPGGTTIENLVVTACPMDDAVLRQFGEAFNPPLTADQVRKLLQKAPSMTKEVANDADCEDKDAKSLHQHGLSSSREDLPQVDTDVGEDVNGAPRAESVATKRSRKAAEVTTRRFLRSFLGRLANRKRVAVQPLSRTSASSTSLCSSTAESIVKVERLRIIHMSKLWRIGDWAFSKIDGFQTSSLAPAKFVSLLVTLAVEGCPTVPAHLSRDELNRLLWHAAASEYGPNASLTSQIYASLPTGAHAMVDRSLGELDSRGYEIIYAEVMGVQPSKAERMIRRKRINSGASLLDKRVLLVFQEREQAGEKAEFVDNQQENQSVPVGVPTNQGQVDPARPVNVYRVNDDPNHGNTLREMMRAEDMERMKRQKEYEEDEKMRRKREEREKRKRERELEKEEKRKKIEEEEKKRREDDLDNDEEEEVFGNVLGLGDDELVQRLLEEYTNMSSPLAARDEEAANEAQGRGAPP
ncbi:hypothetical protein KC345_g735 [Hortaea werneckii]|nr:hypothetical protein KC345_g735 [Hortaea werneckii]